MYAGAGGGIHAGGGGIHAGAGAGGGCIHIGGAIQGCGCTKLQPSREADPPAGGAMLPLLLTLPLPAPLGLLPRAWRAAACEMLLNLSGFHSPSRSTLPASAPSALCVPNMSTLFISILLVGRPDFIWVCTASSFALETRGLCGRRLGHPGQSTFCTAPGAFSCSAFESAARAQSGSGPATGS